MRLLEKISGLVSRKTGLILLFTASLVLLAITQIVDLQTGQMRLRIDPSANRLLSEDNPAKQFYDHARRIFGSDETLLITFTSADVFAPTPWRASTGSHSASAPSMPSTTSCH